MSFKGIGLLCLWIFGCFTSPESEMISIPDHKAIHVYVALCDNIHQGIVPVPKTLGNGQDPSNNLYWGAMYGVKSFLKYKQSQWKLVSSENPSQKEILERVVFYNESKDTYLVADAYDGENIKDCSIDFLNASNAKKKEVIEIDGEQVGCGGWSNLIAYIGHDGLMDFELDLDMNPLANSDKETIILACYSKSYFRPHLLKSGAQPLVWTTGLMAPEAYTLSAAMDSWLNKETPAQVCEAAAQAYHKYQKCGVKGARNLLVTGW